MFYRKQKEIETLKGYIQKYISRIDYLGQTMKKSERKYLADKSKMLEEIKLLKTDNSNLRQNLEITEQRRRSNASAIGGYATKNKKLKEELKMSSDELNSLMRAKDKVDKDFKKYYELYNNELLKHDEDKKIIKKYSEKLIEKDQEIKDLKRKLDFKKNPVTIQELNEYKLFGKPRKKSQK